MQEEFDNQLRGRSGRQGDPREQHNFLFLWKDDLMRIFGRRQDKIIENVLKMPEDEPIQAGH